MRARAVTLSERLTYFGATVPGTFWIKLETESVFALVHGRPLPEWAAVVDLFAKHHNAVCLAVSCFTNDFLQKIVNYLDDPTLDKDANEMRAQTLTAEVYFWKAVNSAIAIVLLVSLLRRTMASIYTTPHSLAYYALYGSTLLITVSVLMKLAPRLMAESVATSLFSKDLVPYVLQLANDSNASSSIGGEFLSDRRLLELVCEAQFFVRDVGDSWPTGHAIANAIDCALRAGGVRLPQIAPFRPAIAENALDFSVVNRSDDYPTGLSDKPSVTSDSSPPPPLPSEFSANVSVATQAQSRLFAYLEKLQAISAAARLRQRGSDDDPPGTILGSVSVNEQYDGTPSDSEDFHHPAGDDETFHVAGELVDPISGLLNLFDFGIENEALRS
ncbi:hypothetical protein HK405_009307 [Cladochytrium tenue]|nr:hypothetical protein HK405_009307 [Cladochytrium tenue]